MTKISEINDSEKIIFSEVFTNDDWDDVNGNNLLLIIKFLYDEYQEDFEKNIKHEIITLDTKKNLLPNLKLVKIYFETLKNVKKNITNFSNGNEDAVFVWRKILMI